MKNFLRNFDQISFWLGFITASLFWWLFGRLRPYLTRARKEVTVKTQTSRQQRRLSDEVRLANDTLRLAQSWHLAAPLFSLDEVLIPPRLLLPPPPPDQESDMATTDISDWAVPFLPDWPQFASHYGTASVSPVGALQGDANLAIIGTPGSGKTVSLAYLASQIIAGGDSLGVLTDYSPILLHAADLPLLGSGNDDPLHPLVVAVSNYAPSIKTSRVPVLLNSLFQGKRALLILDGLDELSPPHFEQVTKYLNILLNAHPEARIVVATTPNQLGSLTKLGFIPTPLANWNQNQRTKYLQNWGQLWTTFIEPLPTNSDQGEASSQAIDPTLIHGWLLNSAAHLTPLEITMKAWASFAGDLLGPTALHALEAHIRRMTTQHPPSTRPALQMLASKMMLSMQPIASVTSAEAWLSGGEATSIPQTHGPDEKERPRLSGALTTLINSGLIKHYTSDKISFAHPVLAGYLASQALIQSDGASQLLSQPEWSGQSITLQYLAVQDFHAAWVSDQIEDESADPILHKLLRVARWLRDAPEQSTWAPNLLRTLATALQKEPLASNIKARIVSALVYSGNQSVAMLLRKLILAPQNDLRQLAALGNGILRDTKSINNLNKLIDDPSPPISRAALLALISIGERPALDAVGYALLHGNESLQQAAAEALANHPEEGHPTLEEGSTLEDPAVRRAVVFGLARIGQPWAISILEKLRTEDDQWVVQDAASQLIEAFKGPNPRLPNRLPALTLTPWLIQFAGEQGIGVAPGKPAYDLLFQALRDGNDEQRLSALHYLKYHGDDSAVMPVYQVFYSARGEVREAAYDVMWHLAAYGIPLPPPIQFGLK
ncbi:HEAT repeat domain-containing protein [Chloroflexota bacterium]